MQIDVAVMFGAFSAVLGFAVAWGATMQKMKWHGREIAKLHENIENMLGTPGAEPVFIRRAECHDHVISVKERVDQIENVVQQQGRVQKRLENFAYYILTTRENLPIDEARRILENGEQ